MINKKIIFITLLVLFISACNFVDQNQEENLKRENLNKTSLDYIPEDAVFLIDIPDYQNQKDFLPFLDLQYSQSSSFAILSESNDIDMIFSQKISDIGQIESLKEILNNAFDDILKNLNSEELKFKEVNNLLIASDNQLELDQIDLENFESIEANKTFNLAKRDFENENSLKMIFLPENFFSKESTLEYAYIETLDNQNITGKILGNQERMDELEIKFNDSSENEFYLFKAVDLENTGIFIEGYDLKSDMEKNLKIEENIQIQEALADIKTATGIDFESDVISWMNEAYIFHVNQSDFTVVFDVKSNRGKALDLIAKIRDLINSIASFQPGLNIDLELENLSENSYLLKISDLESLAFFSSENTEINISFGLSDDNLLFISNKENIANNISRNLNNKTMPEDYTNGQNLIFVNQGEENMVILKTEADDYFIDIKGVLLNQLNESE